MSIVRIGLGETKDFADGYEAIFGKKKEENDQEKKETSKEQDKKDETSKSNK